MVSSALSLSFQWGTDSLFVIYAFTTGTATAPWLTLLYCKKTCYRLLTMKRSYPTERVYSILFAPPWAADPEASGVLSPLPTLLVGEYQLSGRVKRYSS